MNLRPSSCQEEAIGKKVLNLLRLRRKWHYGLCVQSIFLPLQTALSILSHRHVLNPVKLVLSLVNYENLIEKMWWLLPYMALKGIGQIKRGVAGTGALDVILFDPIFSCLCNWF